MNKRSIFSTQVARVLLFILASISAAHPVFASPASLDKNNDGYVVLYSSAAENSELIPDQDFVFTEWGSGSTLNGAFAGDQNYSPVLQVQPGHGWGAPTATLGFNDLQAGFAEGYKSLVFKVKGTDKVYITFADGAESGTRTELGFDLEKYGRVIDDAEGWYQVNIPLSDFEAIDLYTRFAVHSGWAADKAFLLTDIALSSSEVVVAQEQTVQPVPEGPDIYIFSQISRGEWTPYVGDPGWWNQPVIGDETISTEKDLRVTKTTYQNPNDSIQATWSGRGKRVSQFYWQAPQPMDLTEMADKGAAVAIVLRVDKAPKGGVGLRLDCGYPCFAELNMTRLFRQVPEGQWFVIGVELSCFAKSGANLATVLSPFLITTEKSFQFSINQVAILESLPKSQILPCSA